MPIKPRNAPDYACCDCGHLFRQPFWRRLLGLPLVPLPRCPKCGSKGIGILRY